MAFEIFVDVSAKRGSSERKLSIALADSASTNVAVAP